jgi:hypothetical protein
MKVIRYKVTGTHPFPFDMLRYDAAWPATAEDAIRLSYVSKTESLGDENSGRVTIEMCSSGRPTAARWSSFGWRIV